VRHEDALRRLPDLLDDRDDAALLAHVRECADCQRRLFLLGRVDRMLRDGAAARRPEPRFATPRRVLAATSVAAAVAAAALLAVFLPHHPHTHAFMLRTAAGEIVGKATMAHSDGRNVSLALTAHDLPVGRGHMFVLWAGDRNTTMQVGRFMADPRGRCRVRFNLPADRDWRHFWVTRDGSGGSMVAST
jgi:hypothetical protein